MKQFFVLKAFGPGFAGSAMTGLQGCLAAASLPVLNLQSIVPLPDGSLLVVMKRNQGGDFDGIADAQIEATLSGYLVDTPA